MRLFTVSRCAQHHNQTGRYDLSNPDELRIAGPARAGGGSGWTQLHARGATVEPVPARAQPPDPETGTGGRHGSGRADHADRAVDSGGCAGGAADTPDAAGNRRLARWPDGAGRTRGGPHHIGQYPKRHGAVPARSAATLFARLSQYPRAHPRPFRRGMRRSGAHRRGRIRPVFAGRAGFRSCLYSAA